MLSGRSLGKIQQHALEIARGVAMPSEHMQMSALPGYDMDHRGFATQASAWPSFASACCPESAWQKLALHMESSILPWVHGTAVSNVQKSTHTRVLLTQDNMLSVRISWSTAQTGKARSARLAALRASHALDRLHLSTVERHWAPVVRLLGLQFLMTETSLRSSWVQAWQQHCELQMTVCRRYAFCGPHGKTSHACGRSYEIPATATTFSVSIWPACLRLCMDVQHLSPSSHLP